MHTAQGDILLFFFFFLRLVKSETINVYALGKYDQNDQSPSKLQKCPSHGHNFNCAATTKVPAGLRPKSTR
jgi:hypothetical protein